MAQTNPSRRSSNTPGRRPGDRHVNRDRQPRRETPIEEALRDEKEREMQSEIGTIIFVAVMLLLFLCNFGIIGAFGKAVSGFMFGVWGFMAYVFPPLAVVALFFYKANKGNRTAMKKLIASTALYFLISIICDMISKTGVGMESYSFVELFKLGKGGRCGGGLISGSIAYLIKSGLGNVGLVLILILCIVICLIVLTEKSFIEAIKNKGSDLIGKGKSFYEDHEERRRSKQIAANDPARLPNLHDKLKGNISPQVNDNGSEEYYVDDPEDVKKEIAELPPVPVANTEPEYKPTIRDAMRERWNATKEKRAEEKKLNREAKENDSILKVARPQEEQPVYDQYRERQDVHEISGNRQYARPAGYDDQHKTFANGQDDNTYIEESGIMNARLQRGDTIVDMYGRPVFNFTKQDVRSEHNIELKEQYEPMDGEDEDQPYEDFSPRPAYEESYAREQYRSDPYSDDQYRQADTYSQAESAYESKDADEHPVNKVITRVPERTRPRAVAPSEDSEEKVSVADRIRENAASRENQGAAAPTPPERQANSEPAYRNAAYKIPPISYLKAAKAGKGSSKEELEETKRNLQDTLHYFGVNVEMTDAVRGPSVTRYEMTLEPGTKVSKILGLADDIKLALASADIRIEAPIPGKSAVGIEVPNKENSMVSLRELIDSKEFKESDSSLSFAVGKNISGDVIISDIGKMPHVLIAGATGSGKSVCINTLIMSIIYKSSPDEVQMIMIDPKVVELSVYNGIPHLMLPVVTDPKKAAAALAWGVKEMDLRYKKFAELGVRDLKGYNEKISIMSDSELREISAGDLSHFKLPKIVIIIDELADLMMVCGKEVEEAICRLAQLARACGIHLVVATQRPSVDVITGLIKANMPSRMAFAVSSGVDSRTILDTVGAEKLLGKGDMLFFPQGKSKPERVQGAFVSDDEVSKVVGFLKDQRLHNEFAQKSGITAQTLDTMASSGSKGAGASADEGDSNGRDELFAEAGRCIINSGKASIGYLQRMLKIGFNRAARIMDSLAEEGVVGAESGTKAREILMTIEEFESYLNSNQ